MSERHKIETISHIKSSNQTPFLLVYTGKSAINLLLQYVKDNAERTIRKLLCHTFGNAPQRLFSLTFKLLE